MKPNTLIILFIMTGLTFSISSCSKSKNEETGACNAGQTLVTHMVNVAGRDPMKLFVYPPSQDKVIYYYYPANGKVQFFAGYTKKNICTKEHLFITYTLVPSDSAQPLPLNIYGEAYWKAFSDKLILINGTINPGPAYYKGQLTIGLKQAFGDGPGDVDFYLTVEFDSKGSVPLDSIYFMRHINLMTIEFKADNYQ